MNQINVQYHKTKIGELIIGSFEDKLCLLDYRYRRMRNTVDKRVQKGLHAVFIEQDDALIENTKKQLSEYLDSKRRRFDIPLLMVGSEFQMSVWNALINIPYGSISTYLQLAKDLKMESSTRAIASANGANPIAILIPCHRILGSDGNLVGYGGGLPIKKRLLKLEQRSCTLFEVE